MAPEGQRSLTVTTWLATAAVLACTSYVPGRAWEASSTQPGKVNVRFHVIDSCAGTPRLSRATREAAPRTQSAESQTTRPAHITVRCSLPGLRSKVQVPAAVETA